MADKEIIIDGVTVSKCEHSFKQFDNWIGKDIISCDCTLGFRCEPRRNHCKFYMEHLEQQLKRAERKLEIAQQGLNLILTVQKECAKCPHQKLDIDVQVCDLDCATAFKKIAKQTLKAIEGKENERK
nr:MAG TPA: hypothetical protein [Caudoviricetes sp.]